MPRPDEQRRGQPHREVVGVRRDAERVEREPEPQGRRTRRAARGGSRPGSPRAPAGPATMATTSGPGVTARPAARIE